MPAPEPHGVGQVEAIFRYPVKSMAGERLEAAEVTAQHSLHVQTQFGNCLVELRREAAALRFGRGHEGDDPAPLEEAQDALAGTLDHSGTWSSAHDTDAD